MITPYGFIVSPTFREPVENLSNHKAVSYFAHIDIAGGLFAPIDVVGDPGPASNIVVDHTLHSVENF